MFTTPTADRGVATASVESIDQAITRLLVCRALLTQGDPEVRMPVSALAEALRADEAHQDARRHVGAVLAELRDLLDDDAWEAVLELTAATQAAGLSAVKRAFGLGVQLHRSLSSPTTG